jgi:hypothetical protein
LEEGGNTKRVRVSGEIKDRNKINRKENTIREVGTYPIVIMR